MNFDIFALPTPYIAVDEALLKKNLEVLKSVSDRTGAHILLAQKAFSMFPVYPLIAQYLSGTTASGIYEARLGYEEMGLPFMRETHVYSPAYTESDIAELVKICDHIVFNSFSQWKKYRDTVKSSDREISCGIRVNPEYSEIETDIYNPCFEKSRLGVTAENFREDELDGIDGLHFHTMCEQGADTLERTAAVFEEKFGQYLYNMKWVNFGGGHHITREDYDTEKLIEVILHFKEKYGVEVYLEPGEAVALNAGFLVASVIETMKNNADIAILDTSAACHMPDVLEMPYRPNVIGSGKAGEKEYTYRLGAPTCLAGDVIGDYSFDAPLHIGDRVVFCDMAIYSMVKSNTFNGMPLPTIALATEDKKLVTVRKFGFEDFKNRLG